jgi:hypothetical protein
VSGPPTNADTQEFCQTFQQLRGSTPREAAATLSKVGTPSSANRQQRKGFELLVRRLSGLPDSGGQVRLSTVEDHLSAERRHLVGGFVFYVENTCLAAQ